MQDREIWGCTLPVRVPRVHTPKKKCVIAALALFSFPKEELLTGANPKLLRHHPTGRFLGPSQAVPGKSPKQRRQRRAKTQPVETRRESRPYSRPQLLGSQAPRAKPKSLPSASPALQGNLSVQENPTNHSPAPLGGQQPSPRGLAGQFGAVLSTGRGQAAPLSPLPFCCSLCRGPCRTRAASPRPMPSPPFWGRTACGTAGRAGTAPGGRAAGTPRRTWRAWGEQGVRPQNRGRAGLGLPRIPTRLREPQNPARSSCMGRNCPGWQIGIPGAPEDTFRATHSVFRGLLQWGVPFLSSLTPKGLGRRMGDTGTWHQAKPRPRCVTGVVQKAAGGGHRGGVRGVLR